MSKIKLKGKVTVVKERQIEEVTILRIVDFTKRKAVVAFVEEMQIPITLWEGEDYVKIGNWTQEQAEKQLVLKLNVKDDFSI